MIERSKIPGKEIDTVPLEFCTGWIRLTKIGSKFGAAGVIPVAEGETMIGKIETGKVFTKNGEKVRVLIQSRGKGNWGHWIIEPLNIVEAGDGYIIETPRSVYRLEKIAEGSMPSEEKEMIPQTETETFWQRMRNLFGRK